jgi:hypothetical protein
MSVETFPGLPMFVVVAMENLNRASAVRRDAVNQAAIHLSPVYIYIFLVVGDDNIMCVLPFLLRIHFVENIC